MKKIMIMALAAFSVATVSAQECKALYEQGKKLDEAFNKEKPTQMSPDKQISPEAAAGLVEAYDLYQKAVECEKQPNAKGKIEDKLTKKIDKAIKAHAIDQDFNKAAIVLFNAGKRYPEAYKAFMISGMTTRDLGAVADSVYAVDFYNAGNSAFGTNFQDAANAYAEARNANTNEPQVYVYNIASIQQLAAADSTYTKASEDIFAIATEGVSRFGASNDFIFGNYIQHYLDAKEFDKAISELSKYMATEPGNANLFRLRAIVNNAKHQYKEAVPDFIKLSELSNNFEYVRDASSNINSIGKFIMGQLNGATPEQKAEVLNYFNTALKIAEKAKGLEGANGSIDNIIDDINYNIENANKL